MTRKKRRKKRTGFARMSKERLTEIGKANARRIHKSGKAHRWDSKAATEAINKRWAKNKRKKRK